jgi:ABC-type nitrate/sulfonate/bicarbonate transport system substrate-binding protein
VRGIDVLPTIERPGPPGGSDPGGPGGSGPRGTGGGGGAQAPRRGPLGLSPLLLAAAGSVAVLLVVAFAVLRSGDDGGAEAAACPPSDIPDHGDDTLVVEGDAWSGYAPFRDPDLLAGTDYSLAWVEQVCQDVRMADLTAGRADIAVTTLDQYLLEAPAGTVVGVIDQSLGADSMALGTVAHPELDSVDDIPGLVDQYAEEGRKPVLAYTGSSPSEMLLNELANTTELLRLSDFELVSVDQSATAYEMLTDDEAQLAVIWEPETSTARASGYTIALSSADVPDAIVDIIVASDELIERDPGAVQAVLRAFYRRMDENLADADALAAFYAEDGGIDIEAAETLIAGVKFYGTADADAFMNSDVFPLDKPQLEESVDAIGSLLALIHPDITLENAKVDGRYVSALVR